MAGRVRCSLQPLLLVRNQCQDARADRCRDASGEDQAMADAPGAAGIREIITWRGIGLIVSERG